MSEKIEKETSKVIKESAINNLKKLKQPKFFVFLFGFLLPFIAVSVEVTTRMCAGNFFDPLPTPYHALLIAMIPLMSIMYLYFLNEKTSKFTNFLSGMAIGVSSFYTIIFIPIIPIGIFAIIFMGIGFLPLAPLMSMIASIIVLRFFLKSEYRNTKLIIAGIFFSLLSIVSLELPVTLTRYAMEMANSDSSEERMKGIRILRNYGSQDVMLRYCYVIRGQSPDLINFLIEYRSSMTPEIARDIYYKVTGNTFNNVEPPDELKSRLQMNDEFVFDEDQAGDNVGAKLKNLGLVNSRIDGIIDQKAGIAYSEWIMTFKNTANWEQEARFQLKTPENSTVSRLTLWVNGEEREAAFAGKSQVKQAYQSVVAKKRDPVLVTSKGTDRFLVQCYPVPANNGEMKIRIGISSPMYFKNKKESVLVLPQIIERNFKTDKEFKHAVWYDSKNYITATDNFIKTDFDQDKFTLKGSIPNADIESFPYSINIRRKEEIKDSWTIDTTNKKYIIKQNVQTIKTTPDKKLTFVIDGSLETKKYINDISNIIKNIPDSVNTEILVASDYVKTVEGRGNNEKAENLLKEEFVGGQDNIHALAKSIENKDSKIIWLHGIEPEPNYSYSYQAENIVTDLKRMSNQKINELQFGLGSNIISENHDSYKNFKSIPITGNFKESLECFVVRSVNTSDEVKFIRSRTTKFQENSKDQSSLHLEKIWANQYVNNLLSDSHYEKSAIKIASDYHIVTPVSGAVVLENAQQYKDANLKPVEKSSVPIIPEPEEWLLIGVVAMFIIYSVYKRKKTWKTI